MGLLWIGVLMKFRVRTKKRRQKKGANKKYLGKARRKEGAKGTYFGYPSGEGQFQGRKGTWKTKSSEGRGRKGGVGTREKRKSTSGKTYKGGGDLFQAGGGGKKKGRLDG